MAYQSVRETGSSPDDAFGEIVYNRAAALDWNRYLTAMAAAIREGCKIIFTSRSYIWRAAQKDVKCAAFPLFNESKVVVEVEDLTAIEKEKILYNHIRMGNQPKAFKERVQPFCKKLASLKEFLPEGARRLGDSHFTRGLSVSDASLEAFFKQPLPILIESIQQLNPSARALLAIMFAKGGVLVSPVWLDEQDERIAVSHGATASDVLPELELLQESFIRRAVRFDGATQYVFAHPTMREALSEIFAKNPEHLELYLRGARMEDVVREVTCGKLSIPGVRVIVPPSLFFAFIERLAAFSERSRNAGFNLAPFPYSAVHLFLAHRCSRDFLRLALEQHPKLFERTVRYFPREGEPWLSLVARLKQFDILPEALRAEAVNDLVAVADEDLSFFANQDVMAIFDEHDRSRLAEIGATTARNLEAFADSVAENIDSSSSPEDDFQNFFSYCDALKELFPNDESYKELADNAIEYAQGLIDAINEERPTQNEAERDDDDFGITSKEEYAPETRDLFEDVADDN